VSSDTTGPVAAIQADTNTLTQLVEAITLRQIIGTVVIYNFIGNIIYMNITA
jgi:hypothetical protein